MGPNDSSDLADVVVMTTSFTVSQHLPEPATMILLGTGLAGIAAKVRNKRRANQKQRSAVEEKQHFNIAPPALIKVRGWFSFARRHQYYLLSSGENCEKVGGHRAALYT
ncbi:MAG: PEP-CTERM sorting domain-containing protein [Pyrinomonadaceae bacterium]